MTFRLSRHGREHYEQKITTTPPVTVWEASFDGGTTWHSGTPVAGDPDWYRWLIAGDLADPGAAVHVLTPSTEDHQVLARAVANPELIVRGLEPVRIE